MGNAYAVIRISNGNWKIETETNNLQQAYINFHGLCETYWNASDVTQARVYVVDQALNVLKREDIIKGLLPEQTNTQTNTQTNNEQTEAAK